MTIIQKGEPMSDLISRKAAIDAILHITNCKSVRELFEYNQEHHLTEMWSGGVNDAIDAVIGVESAIDNNVGTKLSTNLASLGTDCISRQAAIDAINRAVTKEAARWSVEELPSAEPKRGTWIDTGENEEWYAREYECSECGDTMLGEANFCPNCGADMRGEQDG